MLNRSILYKSLTPNLLKTLRDYDVLTHCYLYRILVNFYVFEHYNAFRNILSLLIKYYVE